jgi:hypothetical protein
MDTRIPIPFESSARRPQAFSDEAPPEFYNPPGEPAALSAARKMVLEWFDEAATLALAEPSEPLIEDLLDEGALSVVYGESNTGKTFVELDLTFSVSTGRLWNSKRVKHGLIVYVCAEGGRRITQRIAALKVRHGDLPKPPIFALVRFPIDLRSSDANTKELLTLIRQAEKQCGAPCLCVVVDTLSRAMAGGDENSPVDMGRIVQAADFIRAETGAHFTYVHHTGKDAARGARGHSLLRAATDTEIEVTAGSIKVTKQRDMESGAEFRFSLVDVILGEDSKGRTIKSAVVEWSDAPPVKSAERSKPIPASQRLLMEVLREALGDASEMIRPFANAAAVCVAAESNVRRRYYARVAETPKADDTPEKLAERQKKNFGSAVKKLIDAKIVGAVAGDGERFLWIM